MISETVLCDIKDIIKKLMMKEGEDQYTMEIRGQPKIGENFVSQVIFIRIVSNNGEKVQDFVVKTAKRSETLRERFPVVAQYKRELFAYSEIFPAFRKFLAGVNPEFPSDFSPKDFWLCHEEKRETLVFEDLKSIGYRMLDPRKPWNLQHSLLVMENYGKFHAISFALKDQRPEWFSRLTKNMPCLHFEYAAVLDIRGYMMEVLENNMALLKESGRNDLYYKFNTVRKEIHDMADIRVDIEDRLTICHGDCWNNNIMFKYQQEKDTSRPKEVKFLDFQLAMVHSPVVDLSLNIYSTSDESTLEHFDLLLETYYKSLSCSIKGLGSDPANLFTYEQLIRHWRKYGLFGLTFAQIAIKYALFTSEEAPDFIEISEGKRDCKECLTHQGENEEEFRRRVLRSLIHFGETFL